MRNRPTPPNQAAVQAKFEEALALHRGGQLARAGDLYRQALALQPRHFDSLHLLAIVTAQSGKVDEAISLFDQALAVNPGSAGAHFNRGNALQEAGRHDRAVESYSRAITLDPDQPEAHFNHGRALADLGRPDEAIASYDRAIALRPGYVRALYNRGNVLRSLDRLPEAVESYGRALAHDPRHADALNNRATSLRDLKRFAEAIADYRRALELKPDFADCWANLASAYVDVKSYAEAAEHFDRAIELGSRAAYLHGDRLHARMHVCDWRDADALTADLVQRVAGEEVATQPFALLAMVDDPALHRRASETLVAWRWKKHGRVPLAPLPVRPHAHRKVRIGYFSADLHEHATAYLMAELFERHDRDRFEIVAFSFGPSHDDAMRRRLAAAFDRFIDVRDRSDREIALLARELGIDIAVDLKGYTGDGRPEIFAYRAAPVQVAYIGYPGTTGLAEMDYLLADRTLVPEASRPHYTERIVTLPHSYQVNDSRRTISDRLVTRAELGLPDHGFVFCCFNGNYKILPATFATWMRLLRQVDGSVLWLLGDSPASIANLRHEAANHGVDGERLVFAGRMPLAEHLARHRAADLFLDTLPYNAHTTASDALWAGLPVLTCIGRSFASRVAASLLGAVGLTELVTTSEADYEALALALARDPERLARLKARLAASRATAPLFDAPRFTAALERAYLQMHARHQAGLPPDHLEVGCT
ncbi:tetratricopeptide repeat protein [Reyranella sp.]|uniref:O-linked N-acetylglucosamine transferase, SPINDLY family protein n=1 Tax=Reyranella sp. TaxID=1929291 RepID=UPI003784FF20